MFHLILKNLPAQNKGTRGFDSRVTTQITAALPACDRSLAQSLDHAFIGVTRLNVLALFIAFCKQLTEDFQETRPQPRTSRLLSEGFAILTRSDHSHKILKNIIHQGLDICQQSPSAHSGISFIFLEHLLEHFHLGHQ